MASALIGLMGLKQSGKDTFAAALTENHGFTRYALADPMREAALALDPLIPFFDGYDRLSRVVAFQGWDYAKEHFPEVRRTLQRFGTEMGRDHFGEDFWVDITFKKVAETPGPVVITDVRFLNEYRRIISEGGFVVRVVRPGLAATDPHPSEALAMDEITTPAHFLIKNDGTVPDLARKAAFIAEGVLGAA